tara:strand:- start:7005 stop:8042 length:1038 start_codon:yes stop_codon:yes gene_type:complete
MAWPDAIPLKILVEILEYHRTYGSEWQAKFFEDYGVLMLLGIVGIFVTFYCYTATIRDYIRPKLILRKEFQEKFEGRIVWIKGEDRGLIFNFWVLWAWLYRKFPRFRTLDQQIGMTLLILGIVKILQSTQYALTGTNIIPVWDADVGIWGRLCFYGSLFFMFGHAITFREDFDKLKGYSSYHIAIGEKITEGKILYFRQRGLTIAQFTNPAQLWINEKEDMTALPTARILQSANLCRLPHNLYDYFVLHDENDAPWAMEDWGGVTHLVSTDLKGSQKLIVSAAVSDPDVLKRQTERATYTFNPDWEKMMLEMASADGTITDEEQIVLDKYFQEEASAPKKTNSKQ